MSQNEGAALRSGKIVPSQHLAAKQYPKLFPKQICPRNVVCSSNKVCISKLDPANNRNHLFSSWGGGETSLGIIVGQMKSILAGGLKKQQKGSNDYYGYMTVKGACMAIKGTYMTGKGTYMTVNGTTT